MAVDNIGLALLKAGLNIVRTGRQDAVHKDLWPCMPDNLGGMAAIGSARGSVIGSGGCDLVRGGRVLSNSTRYCFGEQGRETANRAALSHRYNSA